MLIVGLTGSLGTGKTTVAKLFAAQGAAVIDVDKIAHRLLWRNGKCYKKVIDLYGKAILVRGCINRKKLAEIVFNDKKELRKLEKVLHPVILKEIKNKISYFKRQRKSKVIILDVALLFELGLDSWVDVIIVVKTPLMIQKQRVLKKLKISSTQFERRLAVQIPIKEKIFFSDMTIDNSRSILYTKKKVKRIWEKLNK